MALTFSPENTARIIALFRVLNSVRFVIAIAIAEFAMAIALYLMDAQVMAWAAVLVAVVDATRAVILIRRKQRLS